MRKFQDPSFLCDLYSKDAHIASRGAFLKKYSNRKLSIRDLLLYFLGAPARKRIIDIGAGDCSFIRQLSQMFPLNSFAALDIVANSGCRDCGNIDYRVYEGGLFPSYTASFDIVLLMHMLYHVPDHRLFLQEVKKLVADRHTIFITTKSQYTFPRIENIFQCILADHPEVSQHIQVTQQRDEAHFCSENGATILREMFGSSEYTLQSYSLVTQIIMMNHPQDLCDYVFSTPRYRMPDGMAASIQEAYQRLWLEALSQDVFLDTYMETLYVVGN